MEFFLQLIAVKSIATFLAAAALCLIGALATHGLKVSAEIRAERRKRLAEEAKKKKAKKQKEKKTATW